MIYKNDNNKRDSKVRIPVKGKFNKEKLTRGIKESTILTISLVLIVVGYMSYLSKYERTSVVSSDLNKVADIGDATLVNSNYISKSDSSVEEDEMTNAELSTKEDAGDIDENNSEAEEAQTSATPQTDEYFISSRLERENMYSQNIETYQKILENTNCTVEQRAEASERINEINQTKNSIMIAENLIKTKGFEDCIVFVNTDSISIVVKKEELAQEDIAKIQNIAVRELSTEVEKIHISNKY